LVTGLTLISITFNFMHLKAIIFDWAGTVVDFGSLCPIGAFQTAFMAKGITVKPDDIHRFMGIHKREHISAILALPEVVAKWKTTHGKKADTCDVDSLYEIAEQKMLETVAASATPVPYLVEVLRAVRKQGLKIGSTTGYTLPLMERLVPAAAHRGYAPDFWIASDQVPQGRPWPWMIFKNMEHLKICPPSAVVKLGDTIADIEEANNAGVWSLAVAESSSLVGKGQSDLEAMAAKDRNALIRQVSKKMADAGAHSVIKNLSELPATLEQIENRLEKGQLPPQLTRHRNGRV
jgi:phosphonoacetaldehyde hydrolase